MNIYSNLNRQLLCLSFSLASQILMHFILMYTEKGFHEKSKYCEEGIIIIGYHRKHLYCVLYAYYLSDDDEYEKGFQGKMGF